MSKNNSNPDSNNQNSYIIELPQGKQYSGADVVERLNVVLDAVKEHRKDDKLIYSAGDIYWIVRNMFGYINRLTGVGEFALRRLKSGVWKPEYNRRTAKERKADKRHQRQVDSTREYIKRLKG